MGTHIPTEDQYNAFVTYFTNYMVKASKIRSRADYLTEMRNLNALFGSGLRGISRISRISRISNGQTLRRGGSKNTRLPSKTRHNSVVKRILEERHDRHPFGITYKVRGYSISPYNIDTIILLAMAVAGGAIILAIDPHSLDHRATLRASALGVGGTYALFAAFGFLWCFYITANYKISKAAREVAWIRGIVEKMIQVETELPAVPMRMPLHVTQRTHRVSPSLFPTHQRYTQIMQVVIRESMQMHHRDDGVDEQRLCILATACLAGIVARKLLQPQLTHHMGAKLVGRLGTIHKVLKMLDNAAKSRSIQSGPDAAAMFPFFKDPWKVTTSTSS